MYFVVYTMGQWAWNKRYLILSYLIIWQQTHDYDVLQNWIVGRSRMSTGLRPSWRCLVQIYLLSNMRGRWHSATHIVVVTDICGCRACAITSSMYVVWPTSRGITHPGADSRNDVSPKSPGVSLVMSVVMSFSRGYTRWISAMGTNDKCLTFTAQWFNTSWGSQFYNTFNNYF